MTYGILIAKLGYEASVFGLEAGEDGEVVWWWAPFWKWSVP
jgi:hypothetical protein